MAELGRFREKVREYRLLVSRTQTHLANYLHLDYTELSNRLNATKKARLSHENVRAIVQALAEWGAISTRAQARELLELMDCPYFDEVDWQAPPLSRLRDEPEQRLLSASSGAKLRPDPEKVKRLRAITSNPGSFITARLANFVGRARELAEVKQVIERLLPTGGYLTITGPAGQGKSALIAELITEYRQQYRQDIVQHFIPLNPGPDHQISLLRDLLAQLILKYDLPEFYLSSESRPALRDYFVKALREVAEVARPGELIFIDGLDQLEDELSGSRDLSFLPTDVPRQVVFVLATRPNDTLKPLRLLKPHYEYRLPDLSRADFDLLLARYRLVPPRPVADRYYETMQHNALYLSLAAEELAGYEAEPEQLQAQEIIDRVATNPDRLFSLAFERLRKFRESWREVIRPVLGVLMVAQQPLGQAQLRQLLGLEDDQLKGGLARLGGLVTYTENGRVQLYHLKLRDYLRQDEARPEKEYLFASEEEVGWHARLVEWCEPSVQGLIVSGSSYPASKDLFCQEYAHQYYVRHLYGARSWDKLWQVLDHPAYAQVKLAKAKNIGSYAQDLELGRQATCQEEFDYEKGVALLARLWRYSLLRCQLAEWASQYTSEVEISPLKASTPAESLETGLALAELLTLPEEKADWLLQLARQLFKAGVNQSEIGEIHQILLKAFERALEVEGEEAQVRLLAQLLSLSDLSNPEQAGRAEELAQSFTKLYDRVWALEELANQLLRQGQELEARRIQLASSRLRSEGELDETTLKVLTRQRSSLRFVSAATTRQDWKAGKNVASEEAARQAQAERFLVSVLAENGQWEQAFQITLALPDPAPKAACLLELLAQRTARAESENTNQINQEELVAEATRVIMELSGAEKERQLVALVELLAGLGRQNRAIELIGLIKSQREKIRALVTLARLEGEISSAKKWWKLAEEEIRQIANFTLRAFDLKELAAALATTGQAEEAYRLAGEIELDYLRVAGVAEVVQKLLEAGQANKATVQPILDQTLEPVTRLKTARERTVALRSLVKTLAKSGQIEKALYYARQIPHTTERELAVQGIIEELISGGELAKARPLIEELESIFQRALSLSLIADYLTETENLPEAKTLLGEVEVLENRLPLGAEKGELGVRLIHNLVKLKEWDRAVELVAGFGVDSHNYYNFRFAALAALVNGLRESGQKRRALKLVQQEWREAKTSGQLYINLWLIKSLLPDQPSLAWQIYQGTRFTQNFINELEITAVKN